MATEMVTLVLEYDKDNKQEDYTYMARSIKDNDYVVGYIVIDKPWYSNPNDWIYYIVRNNYMPGGFCGGVNECGLEMIRVDKNTIEPFTQIANIKLSQIRGNYTKLESKNENGDENVVAIISPYDDIPYELFQNK